MNPIIERDIAHVCRVMRASVLSCAPHRTLVDYWRRRVTCLLELDEIGELEICSLRGLLHELDALETLLGIRITSHSNGSVRA